ncbi:ABC transporter ATP-binding protein [Bacteriovorax sp. Seq25_V]|uniref:ABC transporter ATP-binding protein n=1 Tax=Bacteriovorax sp. Seq25_V TaxID=1201288 RepID=UPI00038A11AA|nr:ATP-binding cassette domain-containing protein [Bacteriovorax sp. Seq25_V]EQC44769.1 ABC transporter, ATP-binding protein [Bacteriovorax sp. Seq25_V]
MSKPLLELQDIHKIFGRKVVHQGISFDIFPGQRVGLLGSSGTGKSVLLRSIIGLEYITKGKIYFESKRIDNLSEREMTSIRTQISYSFQSGALFDSMNVFENLAFPLFEHTNLSLDEVDQKIDQMLEQVDLSHAKHLMPSDLSGGMQKRIGMARSMILSPKIILYDEPTAGLDPANTVNVVELMKKFSSSGVTSIFVSHDIPAIQEFCERVIILDKGRVVFDNDIDTFKNSNDPIVRRFLIAEGFKHANKTS